MAAKERLWTKSFLIVTFVQFTFALNLYLSTTVVSVYAMLAYDVQTEAAGVAASLYVVGALVARLFTGRWIVQVGYKKILRAGVVLNVVASLAYLLAGGFIGLLFVRMLHGAAFGIATTASSTIVADSVPATRKGEGIGYYALSQTIATAVGPFIGITLMRLGDYHLIFLVCAAVSFAGLLLLPFMRVDSVHAAPDGEETSSGFSLARYFERRVLLISLLGMLVFACYAGVIPFLSDFATRIDVSEVAGYFFAVYALTIIVTRPLVGRLYDARGENLIMYPALASFTVGMVTFSQSNTAGTFLVAAGLIGFGIGAVQTSCQTIVAQRVPPHRLGLANATYLMCIDIGFGLGPILTGLLIPALGYRGTYLGLAFVAIFCMAFYFLVHGKNARKSRQGVR